MRREATSILCPAELDVICVAVGADATGCLESEKEREFPARIRREEGDVGGRAMTARIFTRRQYVRRGTSMVSQ